MKLFWPIITIFSLITLNLPASEDLRSYSADDETSTILSQLAFIHLVGEHGLKSRQTDRQNDCNNHVTLPDQNGTKNSFLLNYTNHIDSRVESENQNKQIFKIHCSYLC